MKIEHLTNTFVKLEKELSFQLSNCISFSIATSFINEYSIDILENCLKKNKKLQSGRLLIGIYQNFNRKKDLQRLIKLAQQYSKIFQVHISTYHSFHWKYYNFENISNINLFIGSANFTSGGLKNNREIIVKISENKYSKNNSFTKLISAFDKELANSKSISQFNLDYYKESNLNLGSKKSNINPELKSFFENKSKNSIEIINDTAVVTYLTQDLKTSVTKAIENYNPHWNESNVDYFVCNNKRHFELCCELKSLLIIRRDNRNTYRAFWTQIKDSEDSIKIDGCNYFILYEKSRKQRETTLTSTKIEMLRNELKIDLKATKKPFLNKVVRKNQVAILKTIIK